ncbi:MAG: substrate-binding domain-containing protein [Acidimicrobiia bacterium]
MKRLAALLIAVTACGGGASQRIVIGAGTTVVDSGFVEAVVAAYEDQHNRQISIVGESSQRLLDLARRGEVDILITHEPDALAAFVEEGSATRSDAVFASTFLLVGPPERGLIGSEAAEVFSEIAASGLPFVSRADGSGTYLQESIFWALAGVDPTNEPWYQTTGQGMGFTMQVADQRGAFVVVEEGAWIEAADKLSLVEVDIGVWPNVYSATVVAGSGEGAAEDFYNWLISDDGAEAVRLANEELFGLPVYRYLLAERSLP